LNCAGINSQSFAGAGGSGHTQCGNIPFESIESYLLNGLKNKGNSGAVLRRPPDNPLEDAKQQIEVTDCLLLLFVKRPCSQLTYLLPFDALCQSYNLIIVDVTATKNNFYNVDQRLPN